MAAPTTCILFLPLRARRSQKARTIGLCRLATIAGKKSALRTRALPVFDNLVLPRIVPERLFLGVKPACAATWRADLYCVMSGISANNLAAVRLPSPGIDS